MRAGKENLRPALFFAYVIDIGARAITIPSALFMAAICEILGATIAGGPVIQTVSSHIVDVTEAANTGKLTWLMMAAFGVTLRRRSIGRADGTTAPTTREDLDG